MAKTTLTTKTKSEKVKPVDVVPDNHPDKVENEAVEVLKVETTGEYEPSELVVKEIMLQKNMSRDEAYDYLKKTRS